MLMCRRVSCLILRLFLFYLWLNFLHKLHYIIREVFLIRNWIATYFLWWWVAGEMSGPRRHRRRLPPQHAARPERRLAGGQGSHMSHTETAPKTGQSREVVDNLQAVWTHRDEITSRRGYSPCLSAGKCRRAAGGSKPAVSSGGFQSSQND